MLEAWPQIGQVGLAAMFDEHPGLGSAGQRRSTARRPKLGRSVSGPRVWQIMEQRAAAAARERGAVRARRRDRDASRCRAALAGARGPTRASSTARRSARAATPSTPAGSTPPACRGWPLPAAPSREGLPIGMQLIGPYGSDDAVARPGRSLRGRRALGRPLARTLNPIPRTPWIPSPTAVQALVRARQTGKAAAARATARRRRRLCRAGRRRRRRSAGSATPCRAHWKSGGPSRDAVLTHAPLPPAGVWASPADAARLAVSASAASRPRSRCGWAATSMRRLPRRSMSRRRTALVDAMCVSIEIVDSRWAEGRDAPALAKLADLQSHGALVLGDWVPFAPRDWAAQTLPASRSARSRPPNIRGSHSLADPAFVLPAWLRHATRDGRTAAGRHRRHHRHLVRPADRRGGRPGRRRIPGHRPGCGAALIGPISSITRNSP